MCIRDRDRSPNFTLAVHTRLNTGHRLLKTGKKLRPSRKGDATTGTGGGQVGVRSTCDFAVTAPLRVLCASARNLSNGRVSRRDAEESAKARRRLTPVLPRLTYMIRSGRYCSAWLSPVLRDCHSASGSSKVLIASIVAGSTRGGVASFVNSAIDRIVSRSNDDL